MKCFEKILPPLLELHMTFVMDRAVINRESRCNESPVGVSGKVNDTVDITIFPLVTNNLIFTFCTNSFHLNAKVIGTIRDRDVSLVSMIEYR